MSQSLNDYLLMGGYASFVWPAYGIAAVILVVFALDSWRRVHQATTDLRRLEAEIALQTRPAKGNAAHDGPAGTKAGNKTGDHVVPAQPGQQKPGQQTSDQQAGS